MRRLASAVAVLALLTAACSETPTETPRMDAPPVAMNFANAPATSGIVVRDEAIVGFYDLDFDAERTIVVGVSIEEFCGDGPVPDVIAQQDVDHGDDRVVRIQNGQVQVIVYPVLGLGCIPYAAEGIATFTSTDNDFYAYLRNDVRKNANAYGQQVEGTLADMGGAPVDVEYAHRWVYFPNGDVKSKVHIDLH